MNSERDLHIDLCVTALQHLHKHNGTDMAPIHMDFLNLITWYKQIDDDLKKDIFADVSKLRGCLSYENFYCKIIYGYSVGVGGTALPLTAAEKYAQAMRYVVAEVKKGPSAILFPKILSTTEDSILLQVLGTTCTVQKHILCTEYATTETRTTQRPRSSLELNNSNALLHLVRDETRKCVLFAAPCDECFNEDNTFQRIADVIVGYTDSPLFERITPAWNNRKPFPIIAIHTPQVITNYKPAQPTKWVVFASLQKEERETIAFGNRLAEDKLYDITPPLC